MNLNKRTLNLNLLFFGLFGTFSMLFGLPGLGAMGVLFGGINLFFSLILFVNKDTIAAKTCLLLAGIFLLLGFTLCSVFTLRL